MNRYGYDHAALLEAAKKLRRLRIETIGDAEFVAWVISKALRYYADADGKHRNPS